MNIDGPGPFIVFRDIPEEPSRSPGAGRADRAGLFRARAVAERSAAQAATSLEAGRRHQELAHAYDKLAGEAEDGGRE